jgi:N-glycosylase/DNA lyase
MTTADLIWAPIPAHTLNIPATLDSGQCFRWSRAGDEWWGVIGDAAVRLRPSEEGFGWQTYPVAGEWGLLERFFSLDVDLERLYEEWRSVEPRTGPCIERYRGLRILRQDAEEAFFSFICASCNTITKIKRSVSALARRLGDPVAEIDGEVFHAFPPAERIANANERDLRADLWGYRAPRLIELAQHAVAQGPGWLGTLGCKRYDEAHAELASLPGIGPKIADCICLFALGHDEACPVDTHVRQVGTRLFRPDLEGRSLTPSVYSAFADAYRQRFGRWAGWAQQYLFFDELPHEAAHDTGRRSPALP